MIKFRVTLPNSGNQIGEIQHPPEFFAIFDTNDMSEPAIPRYEGADAFYVDLKWLGEVDRWNQINFDKISAESFADVLGCQGCTIIIENEE